MKNGFFIFALLLLASLEARAQAIKSVNFLQVGDISKFVIELDKPAIAERFHVQEDKQIILDIKGVTADKKMLRGINTSEFEGATVYISGYPKPGSEKDIRFAVQLRDNVRSLLESQENKIVLSIENRFGVFSRKTVANSDGFATMAQADAAAATAGKKPDPKGPGEREDSVKINIPKSTTVEDILENLTLAGPKRYVGKRISIYVREVPIADILEMIAETSGFNIIIDSEVAALPPLTLSLTNIPWDQALDTVFSIAKLVASKNSNILSIRTKAKAQTEREAELKAEAMKASLEPLVTKVFPLSYAIMADLKKILEGYITKRGSMADDPRTNSLIIQETIGNIERVKKIIELLDTQTPQILIESKIVEATENYAKKIGLSNGISFGYDPVLQGPITNVGPGFSFSTAGGNAEAGQSAFGLNIQSFKRLANLNVALELMESESKVRIVTAPKIVTQNKREATITSTDTTSFQVQTAQPGAPPLITFQQIPVALSLKVTPQVTNEGSINMAVTVNKGSFGPRPPGAALAPPNTTERQLTTNVLVENGSTIVLGGLYSTETSENHQGIPFLKDLPLVGWLFRTPHNPQTARTELLIFLTPRVINQEEAGLVNRSSAPTL